MKKRNLYLTLVCLCAVACTFTLVGVNTSKNNREREEAIKANEQIVHDSLQEEKPEKPEEKIEKPVVKKEEAKIPEEKKQTVNEETPVMKTEDEVCEPVSGGIIMNEFTDSVLVFQETYGDYRTHNGVDIEAKENDPVSAVKKGVVIKNEFDYEDGYTVEVEHEDGIVSVYKNLDSDKIVKVGQVVRAGDTIGTIGKSAVSESHLPPHLHFEVMEDNVEVNPSDYIPLKK